MTSFSRQPEGSTLFVGSMNAMPMAYARELRARGHQVVYVVDVGRTNTLSRPECHYRDIGYPYPDWIVEAPIIHILIPLFPRLVWWWLRRKLCGALDGRPADTVFLSGLFIALAPLFAKQSRVFFLAYGSDFEVWSDPSHAVALAKGMRHRSLFRFLPSFLVRPLIERILLRNHAGVLACDAFLYFPKGAIRASDPLIERFERAGVPHVIRYDIAFRNLDHIDPSFREAGDTLQVCSATRFLFQSMTEGHDEYSKGSDLLIDGMKRFASVHPNVQFHLFEKGVDLPEAKRRCTAAGLNPFICWHPEVPFQELLDIIAECDVYVDQIGDHLFGTGMYAMYLGKPAIANTAKLDFWPDHPILHAADGGQLSAQLERLADPVVRRAVAAASRAYAQRHYSIGQTIDRLDAVLERQ